jgi:hypothetical protein
MWHSAFPIAILSILAFLMSATSPRAADAIQCSCHFEGSSGYSAVGTRAACSTFTKEKACTVAFGGLGAQAPTVSRFNIDPGKFTEQALRLTMENLDAIRTNAPEKIANAAFLQEAIVVYMRATYLREGLEIDPTMLRDLDQQVQSFSKEFANSAADVFLSRREPFGVSWRGSDTLEIQRGAVRFVYDKKIVLVAKFF